MARRLSLRDRFFTPKVARAIMSPLGIVMAGAGVAGAIVAGLPVAAAAGVGALAWAVRVAVAVPKSGRVARTNASSLRDPWRSFVAQARDRQGRFQRTVASTPAGPLHDHLAELSSRIDTAVDECWRIAGRGDDIDDALAQLDTAQARLRLIEMRRMPDTPSRGLTMASLQAQIDSADRLTAVSADASDRLRLLAARLDELVARAVELSVAAGDGDFDDVGLGSDVDGLVSEMEALRQAVDEADTAGRTGRAGGSSGSGMTLPNP